MKLSNTKEIWEFKFAVSQCKGDVWLCSNEGDRFNLKSTVSQYIALAALLTEKGDNLELFCSLKEDEQYFFKFFKENPDTL